MSDLGIALLIIASLAAFDIGFVGTLILADRRHRANATPQRPSCRFCGLHPAQPDWPWCSCVCAEMDLGLLGVDQ